jgi:hypothetical protein
MDATNANGDLNQSSAPEAQAMPGDESAEQFSVTITANGDGTYSVATSDSDAAQDDPNAQGESGPQTASSIEEVCQIVEQILSAEAGEDGAEAGGDANAPVNDPQAVWQQLAKKTDAKRSM